MLKKTESIIELEPKTLLRPKKASQLLMKTKIIII